MAAAILVAFDTYIRPLGISAHKALRPSHDKPWELLYLLRRRDSEFSIDSTRKDQSIDQIWEMQCLPLSF